MGHMHSYEYHTKSSLSKFAQEETNRIERNIVILKIGIHRTIEEKLISQDS